jgi:hypothetical protein
MPVEIRSENGSRARETLTVFGGRLQNCASHPGTRRYAYRRLAPRATGRLLLTSLRSSVWLGRVEGRQTA